MAGQIKITMVGQIYQGIRIRNCPVLNLYLVVLRQCIRHADLYIPRESLVSGRAVQQKFHMVFPRLPGLPYSFIVKIPAAVEGVLPIVTRQFIGSSAQLEFSVSNTVCDPSYRSAEKCISRLISLYLIITQHHIQKSSFLVRNPYLYQRSPIIGYFYLHALAILNRKKSCLFSLRCHSETMRHLFASFELQI
ncbi:hypothetical protein SDC9_151423 [bioreactor metagenome]|uniref:Uncharacterized protein n=1 Tax=bioreactor metagenome TaxID=1076179 RepID=A0A645EQS4_9ZZZZ